MKVDAGLIKKWIITNWTRILISIIVWMTYEIITSLIQIPFNFEAISMILPLLITSSLALAALIAVMFAVKWSKYDEFDYKEPFNKTRNDKLLMYREKFVDIISKLFEFSGISVLALLFSVLFFQNVLLLSAILIILTIYFVFIFKDAYWFIFDCVVMVLYISAKGEVTVTGTATLQMTKN
jgi:hypothetical protein